MNWIAKILSGKPDDFTKAKLMKYGIGEHLGPRVTLRITGKSLNFKTDLDLEKIFIRGYLQGAPSGKHKVKGQLVSYADRITEFDDIAMPLSWKKSSGKGAKVFKCKLGEVAPLEHIQELLEKDGPTTFFLLSMSPSDGTKPWKITTKTSFPKQGQDVDDEELKAPTFCKGSLGIVPDVFAYVVSEILSGFEDKVTEETKNIEISHIIDIKDIEIPEDLGLSFSEKRKLAKKKGLLKRSISIDGVEYTSEHQFYV